MPDRDAAVSKFKLCVASLLVSFGGTRSVRATPGWADDISLASVPAG